MKKVIAILWGIFIISAFLTQAFGQKELEVMKRYDYSSPKASFESLKKAINEQDVEGIVIHLWQINKTSEEGTLGYGMSFEDFVAYMTEKGFLDYITAYPTEELAKEIKARMPSIVMVFNELYPFAPSRSLKVTELDFIKEKEREHDKEAGVTSCWIVLERKSDGIREEASAENYDGTNEWWIALGPHGE